MNKLKDGVLESFKNVQQAISSTVDWIKEKLGFSKDTEKQIEQTKQNIANVTNNAENNVPNINNWSGGYAGNGGKFEPKGIFHGGEYVMTKEATSRLGINTLNALNYGKQALIAGGLGISVATAAPIQVDNRPPISTRPSISQTMQPMAVNITINAQAGQNERQIAQLVAAELERINRQQQARMRSRMTDRA